MKFNVYLTLKGGAGTVEAPSSNNPIECESLSVLLVRLADSVIENMLVSTIGVRINRVDVPQSD